MAPDQSLIVTNAQMLRQLHQLTSNSIITQVIVPLPGDKIIKQIQLTEVEATIYSNNDAKEVYKAPCWKTPET